jgi:alpha(1,3/1,4) fucosyltransferase
MQLVNPIKKVYVNMIKQKEAIISYLRQRNAMKHQQIRFFNFWNQKVEDIWFYRFLHSRFSSEIHSGLLLNFYSVLGPSWIINHTISDYNVLFTGENLNWDHYKAYKNYGFSKGIDLALGFEDACRENYMRFPLWILYFFPPESDKSNIHNICHNLSFSSSTSDRKFACLVARHDKNGIRGDIMNGISNILPVDSAGEFRNTTSDLKDIFKDNKKDFLQQYNFNICPENSDAPGYVTEKLFQAIKAGCIPIYWGSGQNPEPNVLNHDAILFWEQGSDNQTLIQQIQDLVNHPKRLREFMQQPRLQPHAAEYIGDMFVTLERKLRNVITSKENKRSID